jgi:hypothetical protein
MTRPVSAWYNPRHEEALMTDQLRAWQGNFGVQYTDRNGVDWRTVVPFLRPMLEGLPIHSVLEVGCTGDITWWPAGRS